jgi:hypothetical protein
MSHDGQTLGEIVVHVGARLESPRRDGQNDLKAVASATTAMRRRVVLSRLTQLPQVVL